MIVGRVNANAISAMPTRSVPPGQMFIIYLLPFSRASNPIHSILPRCPSHKRPQPVELFRQELTHSHQFTPAEVGSWIFYNPFRLQALEGDDALGDLLEYGSGRLAPIEALGAHLIQYD